jgi:hypothetical protein
MWKSPLTGIEYPFTVITKDGGRILRSIVEITKVDKRHSPGCSAFGNTDYSIRGIEDGQDGFFFHIRQNLIQKKYLPLSVGDKILIAEGPVEIDGIPGLPIKIEIFEKKL